MENTRVEKFKEYRKSLQGCNSKNSQQTSASNNDEKCILPIDVVIKNEDDRKKATLNDWIERNWSVIKVSAIVVGLCALIVAIILLAIYIGRA